MAAFIFDASGIVKRYLSEIGSGWVQGLTDPNAAAIAEGIDVDDPNLHP